MRAKIRELKETLRLHRHLPIDEEGQYRDRDWRTLRLLRGTGQHPCCRHALRRVVPAMLGRAGDQAIVGIHGRGTINSGPWSTRQALNGMLRGDRLCFPLQPNPRIRAMTKSRSSVIIRRRTLQAGAALHDAAVGEDGRRRYVARSVPGQERNHFRDLFGLGHSTQRNRSVELLHQRRVVHG